MNSERLNLLRKVAQGEITAEDAERILLKHDTENQLDVCDNCIFCEENLELEEEEKGLLN